MEKLLLWRSKITRWLTSKDYNNWKTIFFVLSIISCICVNYFFEYDALIFWTAGVTSLAIAWSLFEPWGIATVYISSFRVCLAWGFLNYSLFVTISSLLLQKEEWGISRVIGMGVAFIVSFILVITCSYISYLLKLNDEKEDDSIFHDKKSKFNRCNFYIVLSIIFLMFLMGGEARIIKNYEDKKKTELEIRQFSQEKWYPVIDWHTEILNGNTVYVIKCAKGQLGIYPSIYPKIRDINSKTQVKFLIGMEKNGLILPKKLDIKN